MGHTALILGDQLMRDHPALEGADRVLFIESRKLLRRPHLHRQRAHLVLAGMRRFAMELEQAGREVEYKRVSSLKAGLRGERDVVCAHPNSVHALDLLQEHGVEIVESNQFLTAPDRFASWADGRKTLKMEPFYRDQRRRFEILLDGDEPVGGRWNFDAENRRPPKDGLSAPDPWRPEEDETDVGVRADLDDAGLWGSDGPRLFAVTPKEASSALRSFISARLEGFGPWQDAMAGEEPFLFHSLLSVPLNLGVLDPLDVVRAAERAYERGDAPIESVEGFVRQIVGWREYVWGMYWLRVKQWPRGNALRARRELPGAFADGSETGWNCLDTVVGKVRSNAYAHHIERLMVLGNISLLAGVQPWESVRWFAQAFADGAEWVMAPNAAGMALYADGGEMMTKPYAAGGNYINKMSTFCGSCQYKPNVRTGEEGCPVTAMYWDFMARHRDALKDNHRMQMPLRGLQRLDASELDAVRARARDARRELG